MQMGKGLFSVLSDKFSPYHNRIVLSLQIQKTTEKSNECTQK